MKLKHKVKKELYSWFAKRRVKTLTKTDKSDFKEFLMDKTETDTPIPMCLQVRTER